MWLRQGTFPTETGRGILRHSFFSQAMKMKVSEEDTCILYASQLRVLSGLGQTFRSNTGEVWSFHLHGAERAAKSQRTQCSSLTPNKPLIRLGPLRAALWPTSTPDVSVKVDKKKLFKGLQENSDKYFAWENLDQRFWTSAVSQASGLHWVSWELDYAGWAA